MLAPWHGARAACPANSSVSNEAALNAAITAYNAANGNCSVTIQLTADIALSASTTPIDNTHNMVQLTINGAGHKVDGQDIAGVRVFEIATSTKVTMNNITVKGGRRLDSSSVAGAGAGIRNAGTLALNQSTVTGNAGPRGAGIAQLGGRLDIVSSTIFDNHAVVDFGGGVVILGGAAVTMKNSTVSGNSAQAGGDGIFLGDNTTTLNLDSVTITDNEDYGLEMRIGSPTLTIRNSIIADNRSIDDCRLAGAGTSVPTIVDQGHNFIGTQDGCTFVDGANGNFVGAGAAYLKPLANYGGPTLTHMPRLHSPLLNTGSTTLTVDQRGVARPIGAAADIGAVEGDLCQQNTWTIDDPLEPEREYNAALACFHAKTTPGVYTVQLTGTVYVRSDTPVIDNTTSGVSLVIQGPGTLHGTFTPSVTKNVQVAASTTVVINEVSIQETMGRGIDNSGNLQLHRCTVYFNQLPAANDVGAGVRNQSSGTMLINQCLIRQNKAPGSNGRGGGIFNAGTMTIRNSTIAENEAGNGGGLALFAGGTVDLDSATITKNTATQTAGGIILNGGGAVVRNSLIADNNGGLDCSSAGTLMNAGHNLVQNPGASCGFVDGVNGDIVGHAPMLGSLRANGGPTLTYELLPGSPATDAGATGLGVDQRNKPRPVGSAPDIGAYEDQQLASLTVGVQVQSIANVTFPFNVTGDGVGFTPLSFGLSGAIVGAANRTDDVPNGHYQIKETVPSGWFVLSIDCIGATAATTDVAMATANLTLAPTDVAGCEFKNRKLQLTLTYRLDPNPHGSLTGTTIQTVNYGGNGTAVTAVPDTGYHFVSWSDNSTANPRTDTNVQTDLVVFASFEINQYTLTYAAGANGSITGTSPQTVNHGSNGSAVTAVPSTGYHFVQWSDGRTDNPRTDTNVQGNVGVTATFAINTYTLTYTAGANGSITGASPQTVNYGSDGSSVSAVPALHYHFVQWSDGATANPRTDTNVQANVSVTAQFAIDTFTLTYAAGANGSISGTSPQTVGYGSSGAAVTAVPSTGYHFVQWSDGSTANPRTDTNVQGNLSVTAQFAINTYSLTYAAGANGTISGASSQTVNYGASGTTVTAVPSPQYHFVQWSDASTQNPRSDTNVQGNVSVTATFAPNILVFTSQPATVSQGNALGAIVVAEQDGNGQTQPDTATVTFTATSNCGTLNLGSAAMVGGVVTLTSTQRYYTLASGYAVTATISSPPSTPIAPTTSTTFDVVSGDLIFGNGLESCTP